MSTDDRIENYVIHSAGTQRAQIARELGLPAPTVASAVRRLLATGAITEDPVPRGHAGPGRPARVLRAGGEVPVLGLIGWRNGGVWVSCLRFDGTEAAGVATPAPVPVTGVEDLDPAIAGLRELVARQSGHALRAVVISVPAPLLADRSGLPVGRPSFSVVTPGDWEAGLARRHRIPVFAENDANLAAIGERRDEHGRGADDFVYLKINGTGFGSAIFANGELIRGAHHYAGELAHVQMDADGPLCACGGRGCLRTQVNRLVVDAAQAAYQRPISLADLPGLAEAGDAGAARMLHDIGRVIGRPLAQLCTFLDPGRVVIDNSLGPAVEHLTAGLRAEFATMAPPAIARHVEIVVSELGPAAERRGALEIVRESARSR